MIFRSLHKRLQRLETDVAQLTRILEDRSESIAECRGRLADLDGLIATISHTDQELQRLRSEATITRSEFERLEKAEEAVRQRVVALSVSLERETEAHRMAALALLDQMKELRNVAGRF